MEEISVNSLSTTLIFVRLSPSIPFKLLSLLLSKDIFVKFSHLFKPFNEYTGLSVAPS